MSEPIKMPQLGSDMTEGTLLNWTKKVGDQIKAGDVIAEIETDKATVEVPSEVSGTILQFVANPGDALQVGMVLGYVGQAGEQAPAGAAPAVQPQAAPAPAPAAAVPQTPADARKEVTPAPEKAPPPTYGAAPKDSPDAQPNPAPAPAAAPAVAAGGNGNYPGGVKTSPVARRLAAERGIDIGLVHGTGPGGRVLKEDVEGYRAAPPAPAAPAPTAGIAAPTYGPLPTGDDVEIIDVTKLRSRIATRMVQSKQQVPHFYVTSEIDVEAMLALRGQLNAGLDEAQKISVNDMVIKATALTLRQYPNLNSHFYGDKMVRHKRINIGIAVALPNGGLMNVVAKDADKTSLGTMAQQNKEMIARARDGKVKPEDVQGSTFTVSNLGAYDVEHFLAIINPPEAGILAIGSARKVPVVKPDGTLGVGNRMKVTISVDHRVSDGAEGAEFMRAFKTLIENPMRLLI